MSDHVIDAAEASLGVAPGTVARIKGPKDSTARVLSKLRRARSKGSVEDGGVASDYSRSTERMLAQVKYFLFVGMPSFDEATGGFPGGRVSEVYGLDGCCKTALAMLASGSAKLIHQPDVNLKFKQGVYEKMDDGSFKPVTDADITVLFFDNEQSLDDGDRLKVNGEEVDAIIGECDTIDVMFKDIDTAITALEEVEAEIEKTTKIKRVQILVVVVDTIAGTSTREEVKAEWAKVDYQRQPKQLRDGFRNMIRRIHARNVCMICNNQVSDSFKPPMPGQRKVRTFLPQDADFSTFGGKALRYYASLRVFMVRVPSPYKLNRASMFADGLQIHFFVSKNRQIAPLRSGRLVLLFKGGLNASYTLLEQLCFLKLITYGGKGAIIIDFARHGVKIPALPVKSLEDQDVDGEAKFELGSRSEWPAFMESHWPAVQQLWAKGVRGMFDNNPVEADAEADEFDLDVTDPAAE